MQIGFVNFNTDEKKRVAKMMQLLQESEAIEELGIGRVRDHFSNILFPGTSTLQHHAKYFVILPSLYYHAIHCGKRFSTISEVDRYIREAEIQITRQLSENADGTHMSVTGGITGILTYKEAMKDYRKYVKYDPAYIYGSGMATYGLIPNTSVNSLILELNNKYCDDPRNKRNHDTSENNEDSMDNTGDLQLIKTSGIAYDFFDGETMNLELSEQEASYLKDSITKTCPDSMLTFLIESKKILPSDISYYELGSLLDGLSEEMKDVYHKSVLFSKLMLLIDWRFNYAYFDSFGKTEDVHICKEGYDKAFAEYRKDLENVKDFQSLFTYIADKDPLLKDFCVSCYNAILEGNPQQVDSLVKSREKTVKHERSKIGNKSYRNQGRGKPTPNTFRWQTVRTMINEMKNPV